MGNSEPSRDSILSLIKAFTGQANILTIPRAFIDYIGSLDGALFLSQLLYWTERAGPTGWFYKSYVEWQNETTLGEYEIRKASKILKDNGLLVTKVQKANGSPTLHYKLHMDRFSDSFLQFLKERKPIFSRNHSRETTGTIAEKLQEPYITEITTETTTKITTETDGRASDSPAQQKMVCESCGGSDVTPLRGNATAGTCGNRKCKGAGKYVNLTAKKIVPDKSSAPPDELSASLSAWFTYNGDERGEESARNLRKRYDDPVLTRAVNELGGKSVRGPWAYICKVADRIKSETTSSAIPSTLDGERQKLYMKLRREMPEQPDSCIWIGVDAAIKAQQASL